MGFTGAVQWWEEWQLRILVLCSLFLQLFLCISSRLRKLCIPSWVRFFIWLAYLGSDAIAIYALAALFNLHKKEGWVSTHRGNARLQVLWAPILLVHLGGQSGITAYNVEDNELWRRHVLTSVSQATVAVYVFCKSWSGDPRYLGTAACLFFVGFAKCILKPWDLKRVSIVSLVSSSGPEEHGGINTLEDYVQAATGFFQSGNKQTNTDRFIEKPQNLCVDIALPYSERLGSTKAFVDSTFGSQAHFQAQMILSSMFDRLYTKHKLLGEDYLSLKQRCELRFPLVIRLSGLVLTVSAFIVFCTTRKEAYDGTDVKITYILLCITAAIDYLAPVVAFTATICDSFKYGPTSDWPDQVAQCNLIGCLARSKEHRRIAKLATLLSCEDYIDQLWCTKPPSKSGRHITRLIHGYVVRGWTEHIKDMHTYKAFNDNRGQWTLGHEGLLSGLGWSLRRAFDESLLLWHLATDFCFYQSNPSPSNEDARRSSWEMSNYMAHLLFVNPEMLMPGARRNLFTGAYTKLKDMAVDEVEPNEKKLVEKITHAVEKTEDSGIVHDAYKLANRLRGLCEAGKDDQKMWEVIQGVWVEMLCFSAARCRGYLHAKNLGKGGEYLSYVWVLLAFMGMETLAETMQRSGLQEEGEEGGGDDLRRSATSLTSVGDDYV